MKKKIMITMVYLQVYPADVHLNEVVCDLSLGSLEWEGITARVAGALADNERSLSLLRKDLHC